MCVPKNPDLGDRTVLTKRSSRPLHQDRSAAAAQRWGGLSCWAERACESRAERRVVVASAAPHDDAAACMQQTVCITKWACAVRLAQWPEANAACVADGGVHESRAARPDLRSSSPRRDGGRKSDCPECCLQREPMRLLPSLHDVACKCWAPLLLADVDWTLDACASSALRTGARCVSRRVRSSGVALKSL